MKSVNMTVSSSFYSVNNTVLASAFLFVAALVVEMLAISCIVPALISYLGFFLLIASAGVLMTAFVSSLRRGSSQRFA